MTQAQEEKFTTMITELGLRIKNVQETNAKLIKKIEEQDKLLMKLKPVSKVLECPP